MQVVFRESSLPGLLHRVSLAVDPLGAADVNEHLKHEVAVVAGLGQVPNWEEGESGSIKYEVENLL